MTDAEPHASSDY